MRNHAAILHYTYHGCDDEGLKDNDNYHDDVHDNDGYAKCKYLHSQMDVGDSNLDNSPNNKASTNGHTLVPRNNQK